MTTTPLPPLPESSPLRFGYGVSDMTAYARQARADLEAEVKRLREALSDIAQYTGEGPASTPWRDIVKACGEKARAALENTK